MPITSVVVTNVDNTAGAVRFYLTGADAASAVARLTNYTASELLAALQLFGLNSHTAVLAVNVDDTIQPQRNIMVGVGLSVGSAILLGIGVAAAVARRYDPKEDSTWAKQIAASSTDPPVGQLVLDVSSGQQRNGGEDGDDDDLDLDGFGPPPPSPRPLKKESTLFLDSEDDDL